MELVRTATAAGVATLTLDSPANRNALSTPLMRRLLDHLAATVSDPAVRVVVLTHTGPVFCSGADLKETAEAPRRRPGPGRQMLATCWPRIWEFPKPVIARVGGPARAGGLGLIAAADIAVCADAATFAFSEVRVGVIPAIISATVLPRLAPRAAAELYLTGNVFDGRAGGRDRPGHLVGAGGGPGRGGRRVRARPWSAAAPSRWPAPSSCYAGPGRPASGPSWPSCRSDQPVTSARRRDARASPRSGRNATPSGCRASEPGCRPALFTLGRVVGCRASEPGCRPALFTLDRVLGCRRAEAG